MLCCASLRLRLRTLCAGSRSEALVGFVAEKLSQVVGDFPVNLFGTEQRGYREVVRYEYFVVTIPVCDSGSIHCAQVAEVRHSLDL